MNVACQGRSSPNVGSTAGSRRTGRGAGRRRADRYRRPGPPAPNTPMARPRLSGREEVGVHCSTVMRLSPSLDLLPLQIGCDIAAGCAGGLSRELGVPV